MQKRPLPVPGYLWRYTLHAVPYLSVSVHPFCLCIHSAGIPYFSSLLSFPVFHGDLRKKDHGRYLPSSLHRKGHGQYPVHGSTYPKLIRIRLPLIPSHLRAPRNSSLPLSCFLQKETFFSSASHLMRALLPVRASESSAHGSACCRSLASTVYFFHQ